MSERRKPTRRDLLIVIGRLQSYIGKIMIATSDRNLNRAEDLDRLASEAHELCIDARAQDSQIEEKGPWATTHTPRTPSSQSPA